MLVRVAQEIAFPFPDAASPRRRSRAWSSADLHPRPEKSGSEQRGTLRNTPAPWWRSAVIYQVCIRSFADNNGDGDISGLRSRLPYLAHVGGDTLWINPWYPSPLADGGYGVPEHRDTHPAYGALHEAGHLITEAHDLGLQVILDLTPHQHPWFQQVLAAAPVSRERARYLVRDGLGTYCEQPPNGWHAACHVGRALFVAGGDVSDRSLGPTVAGQGLQHVVELYTRDAEDMPDTLSPHLCDEASAPLSSMSAPSLGSCEVPRPPSGIWRRGGPAS